jgi:hypothetical protein
MKLRAKPKLRITESRLQSLIETMVRSVLKESRSVGLLGTDGMTDQVSAAYGEQPSMEQQFLDSVSQFFGQDVEAAKEFLKSVKDAGFEMSAREHGIEGDAAYELMKMISGRDASAES